MVGMVRTVERDVVVWVQDGDAVKKAKCAKKKYKT